MAGGQSQGRGKFQISKFEFQMKAVWKAGGRPNGKNQPIWVPPEPIGVRERSLIGGKEPFACILLLTFQVSWRIYSAMSDSVTIL